MPVPDRFEESIGEEAHQETLREPEAIVVTPEGMIMVEGIKYQVTERQVELFKVLAAAPGRFMSTAEISDSLRARRQPEVITSGIKHILRSTERFSKERFESRKVRNRVYFRMLGHISLIDETDHEE